MATFITGANRGLGLEFARVFAAEGLDVVATCRDPSRAEALKELGFAYSTLSIEPLDLTSDDSISNLASHLAEQSISIDLLISNAGILENEAYGDWSRKRFAGTFHTNVIGPALLAQELDHVLTGGAKIVQLSSGLGSLEWGGEGMSDGDSYSMSKAALNMLTVRLARSFESSDRVVVSMSPGWVATDMGGAGADLSVEESVSKMVGTIESLTRADTGRFIDNRGNSIPW
ncbi:MAG TPA: short-chain dehydrogenase [Opitutae bacterium]|nr:short-chain dehydrogenase [Opitutaceae bacterium]HCR31560.1 short-chain dehydrogenase [Opitutae bacterium]